MPNTMLGRHWARGVLSMLAAGVLGLSSGCHREENLQAAMPARPPAAVTVASAVARDVPVYLDAIGKTVSPEVVSVVPQVGGKIISAEVKDGQYVTRGQLLFEIDPRWFQAELASAEATAAQNQAELALARTEFSRTEQAARAQAVSPLELEQRRSAVAVAEAQIASARAAIDRAKLNLEYTKIYAPISGRGGVVLVNPGNVVKANEGALLVIQRLDPIYAEFTVTENDLGTVRKYMAARGLETGREPELGLRVQVDVPGDSARVLSALGATAVPATQPEATTQPGPATQSATTQPTTVPVSHAGWREGTLTFLDNTVQDGTGTVRLRATVPNADRFFWPGQFVNVRVTLTIKKDAVLVPAQAQQIGQQGPYVYVVGPDGTAELRPITPGQRQGDLLVVERGVRAGEPVVTTGQMAVMPGAKVMVTNPPGGAVAGGGGGHAAR